MVLGAAAVAGVMSITIAAAAIFGAASNDAARISTATDTQTTQQQAPVAVPLPRLVR